MISALRARVGSSPWGFGTVFSYGVREALEHRHACEGRAAAQSTARANGNSRTRLAEDVIAAARGTAGVIVALKINSTLAVDVDDVRADSSYLPARHGSTAWHAVPKIRGDALTYQCRAC